MVKHGMVVEQPLASLAVVAMLVLLLVTPARAFAALAALVLGTGIGIWSDAVVVPEIVIGLHLPLFHWPAAGAFSEALTEVAPGQLALTVTNAVLATAALAAAYFPSDTGRISPRRLALSSGLLNLVLAPFGARTWRAPAIFGLACLALGLLLGGQSVAVLALVPAAVLGALLAVAGAELAMTRRLFDGRPSCLVVIVMTARSASSSTWS